MGMGAGGVGACRGWVVLLAWVGHLPPPPPPLAADKRVWRVQGEVFGNCMILVPVASDQIPTPLPSLTASMSWKGWNMTNEVISDVSMLITPFCSNFVTDAGNEATMEDLAICGGSSKVNGDER